MNGRATGREWRLETPGPRQLGPRLRGGAFLYTSRDDMDGVRETTMNQDSSDGGGTETPPERWSPDYRKAYLQEREIVLEDARDIPFAQEAMVRYGLSAIRSAFVLNGGAMLVLAPYISLFVENRVAAERTLLAAGLAFVAGIVLSAVSTAGAYFGAMLILAETANRRNAQLGWLEKGWYPEQARAALKKAEDAGLRPPRSPEEFDRTARRASKAERACFWTGVGAAVLAYVAFVVGAWFAMSAVVNS
jgi:hypothetical protein